MRLTFGQLKGEILTRLDVVLSGNGFVLRPRSQQFERNEGEVVQIIHINFAERRQLGVVDVSVHLAVRHKTIEMMVTRWWKYVGKRQPDRSSATLGAELGHIVEGKGMSWRFEASQPLGPTIDAMTTAIAANAFSYLDKHKSIDAIVARLSSPSFREWHQFLQGRALRLPLALVLLGRNELACSTAEEHLNLLITSRDPLASDYERFPGFVRATGASSQVP